MLVEGAAVPLQGADAAHCSSVMLEGWSLQDAGCRCKVLLEGVAVRLARVFRVGLLVTLQPLQGVA